MLDDIGVPPMQAIFAASENFVEVGELISEARVSGTIKYLKLKNVQT